MNHPKLYKRTVLGTIQVWWQEIDGDHYRTHSAKEGGTVVTSDWTYAQPKNAGRSNATTAAEQAAAEVASNYRRKRKDGYSETIQSAKDSNRFSPMLAKNFEDYEKKIDWESGVWCQPKLDGIRCIARASGLWSRKGDRIVSCPHIEAALAPIFATMPGLVLDGELYNHDLKDNFNEITSLVKTLKPSNEHLAKTAEVVQYHVYDEASEDSYDDRLWRVLELTEGLGSPLVMVETQRVAQREWLDEFYDIWLEAGYEGQMIRLPGPYEQKRSRLLLKRKEFVDSEFEVLDIIEGVGNASGGAKVAWFRLDTDPNERFKADIMGTKAERAEILRRKDALIGKMATVKYFKQRTPAGKPRFGKVKAFHEGGKW